MLLRHIIFSSLIVSSLIASPAVQAHVVVDALKAADRSKSGDWHYRLSESINGKAKAVALFDPSNEKKQQWKLESYEGKEPSAKEVDRFMEKRMSVHEEKLLEQIDETSLVALDSGSNPKRWSFRMRKDANLDGVPPEKLSGIITLNEQGDLQRIEYKSSESFRVKLVMKINKLLAVCEYEKQKNGDVLAKSEWFDSETSFMGKEIKIKMLTSYDFLRHK